MWMRWLGSLLVKVEDVDGCIRRDAVERASVDGDEGARFRNVPGNVELWET